MIKLIYTERIPTACRLVVHHSLGFALGAFCSGDKRMLAAGVIIYSLAQLYGKFNPITKSNRWRSDAKKI